MRVLVVPKWYPSVERPGFGIFCREQASALSADHDVVVLASEAVRRPEFPLFRLTDEREAGLRTIRIRYRRPALRAGAMLAQAIGMLRVLWLLRRAGWRPEIVHAHVYSAGLPALMLARLSGAPLVITEHFTGFARGLITGADRLTALAAFRGADLVAPVSRELAARVAELAPHTRIEVVANVVDTATFHPPAAARPPLSGRSLRLLNVAALTAKKGHGDLLRALASLSPESHFTLTIAGGGELDGALRLQTAALGLTGVVRFLGPVSQAQVAELMRGADLFVLPSRHENLPCVLLEAMASGLPVLATAVGGVPEVIDERSGVLCAPGDPRALADGITKAAAILGAFDGAALAQDARERFGYETFSKRWSELYAELGSSAGSTRSASVRTTASGR